MEPNLIITYDPSHPGKAEKEVGALLHAHKFEITDSSNPGLFLVHLSHAKEAVKSLRRLPEDSFEVTFKWIPIETWTRSDDLDIDKILVDYNERIGEEESWKLALGFRMYKKHGKSELTRLLTRNINRKNVDLKNPDKIVVVEIIGGQAGLSLLDKSEYLDTQKMQS